MTTVRAEIKNMVGAYRSKMNRNLHADLFLAISPVPVIGEISMHNLWEYHKKNTGRKMSSIIPTAGMRAVTYAHEVYFMSMINPEVSSAIKYVSDIIS